jgi:hypothetical protein
VFNYCLRCGTWLLAVIRACSYCISGRRCQPKNSQLSTEQRQANGRLARLRIRTRHVTRSLKVFRILSDPKSPTLRYRNRRKRLALRFRLIAGIFDLELALACLS